ncbi:ditrans,polycis-polyprenyl diphosphate synthase [Polyrhizophydium stewartii]|uniref:Ditrans,polycis-polyprenyl diphosphate synthase n=1 Tax=Polyrhizophydium stewartii TaxID=2732419 RepID=A0ABR4N5C3_9FUNG
MVAERISRDFPAETEPDLAFVVGGDLGFTLCDAMPWSIRLTEFHHIPCLGFDGGIHPRDFRRGMVKFARCEQRFGK